MYFILVLPKTKGWAQTRLALAHVHDNFLQDFLFFMKASDLNYVVVENLRGLLLQMDPYEPLLIGRQLTVSCCFSSALFVTQEIGNFCNGDLLVCI